LKINFKIAEKEQ